MSPEESRQSEIIEKLTKENESLGQRLEKAEKENERLRKRRRLSSDVFEPSDSAL